MDKIATSQPWFWIEGTVIYNKANIIKYTCIHVYTYTITLRVAKNRDKFKYLCNENAVKDKSSF